MSTRRKYDITSTEILEVARSTAALVVDELRARADELLPSQLYDLQRVSQQLLVAANEVVRGSSGGAAGPDPAGLDAFVQQLRAAIVGDLGVQQRQLADALDLRLSALAIGSPAQPDDMLPSRIAAAVVAAMGSVAPSADVAAAINELHARLNELAAAQPPAPDVRGATQDRLDDLLVEIKAGIGESIVRQHAVLLEAIDERLDEVHLNELAQQLPGRVGLVISEAIERSHAEQAVLIEGIAEQQRGVLDAALERQRSGIAELTATAGKVVGSQEQSAAQVASLRDDLVDLPGELTGLRAEVVRTREDVPGRLAGLRDELAADLSLTRDTVSAEISGLRTDVAADISGLRAGVEADVTGLRDTVSAEISGLRTGVAADLGLTRDSVAGEVSGLRTDVAAEIGGLRDALADELGTTSGAITAEVRGLREEVGALRDEIATVRGLRTEVVALGEEIAGLRTDIAAIPSLLDPLRADVAASRDDTAALTDALAQLGSDLKRELIKALADVRGELLGSTSGAAETLARRAVELAESQHALAEEVREATAAGLNRQEAALVRIRQVELVVTELAATFPDQAAAAIAGLGDAVRDHVRAGLVEGNGSNPLNRMEKNIAQVAWSLGELRATAEDLLGELSRLAADLPEASAALRDAASRSEARLTDLVLRLGAAGPSAAPRLVHGAAPTR